MKFIKLILDIIFGRSLPKPIPQPKPVEPINVVPDPTPEPTPEPPPKPLGIAEQLLAAHNEYRARNGKAALKLNEKLTEAAMKHAAYMESVNVLTHRGRKRDMPWDRAMVENYQSRNIAENIAYGSVSVDSVMTMWINSSGHKENMLGSFKDFGAAKMGNYWCVVFGG